MGHQFATSEKGEAPFPFSRHLCTCPRRPLAYRIPLRSSAEFQNLLSLFLQIPIFTAVKSS